MRDLGDSFQVKMLNQVGGPRTGDRRKTKGSVKIDDSDSQSGSGSCSKDGGRDSSSSGQADGLGYCDDGGASGGLGAGHGGGIGSRHSGGALGSPLGGPGSGVDGDHGGVGGDGNGDGAVVGVGVLPHLGFLPDR